MSRSDARFDSLCALVTGAGGGIGRSVARKLVAEGARVALLGRRREPLEETARGLPVDRVLIVPGAHEQVEDVRRALSALERTFGRLDLVFNNAGSYHPSTLAETDDASWAETIASNLTGPFVVTREALPLLRRTRGVIVNNASTLGMRPVPGVAAYAAAKAALIQLTRSTALEEAPHGVRAVAICPGVVETPMHDGRQAPDGSPFLSAAAALHPLGRIGQADEVADLVLFLASSSSSWTTGAVIPIDGGISLA